VGAHGGEAVQQCPCHPKVGNGTGSELHLLETKLKAEMEGMDCGGVIIHDGLFVASIADIIGTILVYIVAR
jgi:hypothetical protein